MSKNTSKDKSYEFEIVLKKYEKENEDEKSIVGSVSLKFMDVNSLLLSLVMTNNEAGALELIKQGADPNAKFSDRHLPLCEAIRLEHHDMVLLLLNNAANVNEECRDGTPIFCALDHVINHDIDEAIVTTLLIHGAKLNVKNYVNETPLEFTMRREGYRLFRYDSQIDKLIAFACLNCYLENIDHQTFGIEEFTQLNTKWKDCMEQLMYMQHVGEINEDHNYYAILVSQGNKLMRLAANKKLRKNIYTAHLLDSEFGYYTDIVIEKFVIALKRYNAYLLLVKELNMLPEIAEIVCKNLSDYDVRFHRTWEMDLPELLDNEYYQ